MDSLRREVQRIDVYQEYAKIPAEEIARLAQEKVLPHPKLAEMWNWTFPFIHQAMRGEVSEENVKRKIEEAQVFLRGASDFDSGHITVLSDHGAVDPGFDIWIYLWDHFYPLLNVLELKRRGDPYPIHERLAGLRRKYRVHSEEEDGTRIRELVNYQHPFWQFTDIERVSPGKPPYFGIEFSYFDWTHESQESFEKTLKLHKKHWVNYTVSRIKRGMLDYSFGGLEFDKEGNPYYPPAFLGKGYKSEVLIKWRDRTERFAYSLPERFAGKIWNMIWRAAKLPEWRKLQEELPKELFVKKIAERVHIGLFRLAMKYGVDGKASFETYVDDLLFVRVIDLYRKEHGKRKKEQRTNFQCQKCTANFHLGSPLPREVECPFCGELLLFEASPGHRGKVNPVEVTIEPQRNPEGKEYEDIGTCFNVGNDVLAETHAIGIDPWHLIDPNRHGERDSLALECLLRAEVLESIEDPVDRQIVKMKDEGYKQSEIAKELKISEPAVSKRWRKLERSLELSLKEAEEE